MEKQKCPYCGSPGSTWRGYRYNEKTKKRMRLCRSCGRKFTPRDKFFRMRVSPEEIMEAVSLYRKGFSSSEVQKHLRRKGMKVSRWSIIKWARKYSGG